MSSKKRFQPVAPPSDGPAPESVPAPEPIAAEPVAPPEPSEPPKHDSVPPAAEGVRIPDSPNPEFVLCKAVRMVLARGMPAYPGELVWLPPDQAERLEKRGDLELV